MNEETKNEETKNEETKQVSSDGSPDPSMVAIERTLAAMSQPVETGTTLWRAALESQQLQANAPPARRLLLRKIAPYAVAALLVLAAGAVVVPSLGRARSSRRVDTSVGVQAQSSNSALMRTPMPNTEGFVAVGSHALASQAPSLTAIESVRHVVRKASIDVRVADVRGSFAKVAMIPNQVLGEYVESSSLTGEEPNVRGTLTLRVSAAKMSDALNQLRAFGSVTGESSTGDDVTDRVVDLDARIRNEERIEREILALLDKRADAPLSDVLAVRAQLSDVRGRIESLKGQRERVGQLVSLATIVVNLQGEAEVPVVQEEGMSAYFERSIDNAWRSSLASLSDTAAFLVRVLVGGIVWWILLAFAVAATWRGVRAILSRHTREPAPRA